MNKSEILDAVNKAVSVDRAKAHGQSLAESFSMVATLWSTYLGFCVSDSDVAQMMVLLKVARSKCGDRANVDHYMDAAGYSAIAGELATEAKDKAITGAV